MKEGLPRYCVSAISLIFEQSTAKEAPNAEVLEQMSIVTNVFGGSRNQFRRLEHLNSFLTTEASIVLGQKFSHAG